MSKRQYYVFLPSPVQEEPTDPSKILFDLGRATKRGIRKCFKCGTYNGTRSLMCKNKQCDAVFKDCAEKRKTNLDAIKLISGTSRQVFSVRVCDKGPDCRGFVQLPLMQGNSQANEKNVALSEVALCFVDSCQRLFDDSILKCHETDQSKVTPICIHIKSALKSINVAVPIETKNCILNSLNFDEEMKSKLWSLSTETEGALVQRVSKTVMAVKCQVTSKHPLGYLHFTFCITKGRQSYDKFYCSCLNFKGRSCVNNNLAVFNQRCIHFYACIWAFASDLRFTEEFIDFLNLVLCSSYEFATITNNNLKTIEDESISHSLRLNLKKCKNVKRKSSTLNLIFVNGNELCSKQKVHRKLATKPIAPEISNQKNILSEVKTTLNFMEWLTSVTEKLNQVLPGKQNGPSETLSFYIPSKFYQLLEERIHNTGKQWNHDVITNSTKSVSYLIYSIPHLKAIFDTPQISLGIVEVFRQNHEETKLVDAHLQNNVCESPTEYQQFVTFLKVGVEKSQQLCIPFTIGWSPDVMPVSNFGKLELTFSPDCFSAM